MPKTYPCPGCSRPVKPPHVLCYGCAEEDRWLARQETERDLEAQHADPYAPWSEE